MLPAIPSPPPHRPLIYMLVPRDPCGIEIASPSVRRRVLDPVLQAYLDGPGVCLEPFGTGEASRNRADFGEATW